MSGVSDGYDSDSDSDDEQLELANKGIQISRTQDALEELTNEYMHSDGELPWRVLMHASDPFVLWSCATGVAYRGPLYSNEPNENGSLPVVEHAKYVQTRNNRMPDIHTLLSAVRTRLTTNEMIEFEEQLFVEEPDSHNLVGFITQVLYICNMQCTPENICYFVLELPRGNML